MPSPPTPGASPALEFGHVDLDHDGTPALRDISWQVSHGERWVVLGPNGSGKTTLLRLASGYLHPTRGTVSALGRRLGRTDVRALRQDVAIVSTGVAKMVSPQLPARDVVLSGRYGALEPWWHDYRPPERQRAYDLLASAGFGYVTDRAFGLLSDGERQQVLLARALMNEPQLLLLDEPCAGLDMGGRERLLSRLGTLADQPSTPPMVMVTHHVEEIPTGFTHVMLLKQGHSLVAGPIRTCLTAALLSECFDLKLALTHRHGRWASRAISAAGRPDQEA